MNKRVTITIPYDLYLWLESYSSDFHASISEGVTFLLEESQTIKEYEESLQKNLRALGV
jgi:macrodomain Ter protein organizer (MatP/YcbG family)